MQLKVIYFTGEKIATRNDKRLFKALQVCIEESIRTGRVAVVLMPMLKTASVECAALKILGLFLCSTYRKTK